MTSEKTSQEGNKKAAGYKDLLVWQKGIALAREVYHITATFPRSEQFGLASQMRRAAVSIPSNIAEGQARHTTQEFIRFISHAEGSVAELDTQFILAMEMGYCAGPETGVALMLISELRKMLNTLRRRLQARNSMTGNK